MYVTRHSPYPAFHRLSSRLVWNSLPRRARKWSTSNGGWVDDFLSSHLHPHPRLLDRLTNECDGLKRQMAELTAVINEPFDGSIDELKSLISNFQRDQDKKRRELDDLDTKKSTIERQIKQLVAKRTSDTTRLGAFEFEERQYKSNVTRHQQLVDDYRQHSSDPLDHAHLDKQLKSEQKHLLEQRTGYQQKEIHLQQNLDKCNEQRIKAESNIKLKSSQVEKNLREIQEIKQQQKQIEQYSKQLTDLNKRIERKEDEYSRRKISSGTNLDQLKIEISSDEQKRAKLQFELKDLNHEIDQLLVHGKINTEHDMFKREKSERDEQIRRIKLRHHEALTTIFHGDIPEQDAHIGSEFEIEHRKLQQARSTSERQIQDIRQELSGKEEKRRLLADDLRRKDSLRTDYNERLQEQLNGQVYEEYLEKLSNDVKQKQDEKGNLIGMEKTYQKFVSQVRSTLTNDPCCPLCYRKFDKRAESEQLIRDMELQIKGPEYRRKLDRDLALLQEKFEQCLNLKSVHSQAQELADKDLPNLRNQIKQLDKEIVELKSRRTTIERELNEQITLPLEQCEQIKTDIIMLDKYISEREEFEARIHVCQEKLGQGSGTTASRSLEQVQQAKNEAQNAFDQLDQDVQRKYDELRSQQDLVQELRESLTELKNEKLKLSSDVQKKERLDEQLSKLTQQIQTLKDEIEHDKQSLEPIIVSNMSLLYSH